MGKKRFSVPAAAVILLMAFTNCYSRNIAEIHDSLSKNYPQIQHDNSKLYSEDSRRLANDWFSHYLLIKNALADDNSAEAQKHALQLMDAIDLAMPDMSGVNSDILNLYTSKRDEIKTRITGATDITEQRKLFSILNANMVEYLRSSGLYDKNIYLLTCADVDVYGNAVWFSDAVDSKNPYTGANGNSDCISVKENWNYK